MVCIAYGGIYYIQANRLRITLINNDSRTNLYGLFSTGSLLYCSHEAVVIDPLQVFPYMDRAKDGVKIKYILETHFHADFVSGHIDLAKKTGATIVFGPNANPHLTVILLKTMMF